MRFQGGRFFPTFFARLSAGEKSLAVIVIIFVEKQPERKKERKRERERE
jgi:hypothetical protein